MIDVLVPILLVAPVALALWWAWARVAGNPRSRFRALLEGTVFTNLAFVLVLLGANEVAKLRRWQAMGELFRRGDTEERVVALTFDDGPTAAYADSVLGLLEREGVRATFFVIGQDLERAPEVGRRLAAAGHELGNHSYTHRVMAARPLREVRREVERTDRAIRATGYAGPIHFRSPYGKKLLVLPYYLAREGRTHVFWDLEPESDPEVEASAGAIARHVVDGARPGSVVLLHPWYGSRRRTREALPAIVRGLKARGFRFVTVSELMAMSGRDRSGER
ncbi:MAG TPA: polysaccharide deacetylase family protein [Longimicrobium sp.]|nr:polysaccharide deacetylase family protein [Longimicrobium sp.]